MKILLYPVTVRGKRMWRLDYREGGRRRRPTFGSKQAAENERTRLSGGAASAKAVWEALRPAEREDVILAYARAQERGHSLHELLRRSDELQPHEGPALGKVVAELLQVKKAAGRSKGYRTDLRQILEKFAQGRESVRVDAVTVADVERFLDVRNLASRSTIRARLSTLFKFAVRRGYRPDDPCAMLEPVTYVKPPPRVLTIDEFRKAVRWLKAHAPHGLAWFALSTVCGLRPEEAEKTTRKDIHLKEGFIRVDAQTTKVRERRVAYPKREAMRFLKWSLDSGGKVPLDPQVRRRLLSGVSWKTRTKGRRSRPGLRDGLGWDRWPQDVTRHTAASYWLAADGSAAHVAEMLGNSESVLKRDYRALVTKAQAERFWKAVTTLSG